jgi:hypothetical protein
MITAIAFLVASAICVALYVAYAASAHKERRAWSYRLTELDRGEHGTDYRKRTGYRRFR